MREDDSGGQRDATSLDSVLALLKKATIGVMGGDGPALQKANAVARLGSVYLKLHDAAELEKANALLRKRVTELEQRVVVAKLLSRAEAESAPSTDSPGAGAGTDRVRKRFEPPFASLRLTPTRRRPRRRE
jgi:hypothetical protein